MVTQLNPALDFNTTAFPSMGRNRLINGEMAIDQANGGTALTVNGTADFRSTDMWIANGRSAAGVFTLQRATATPPTGFPYYLRATVSTARTPLTSNDNYTFQQRIEGLNVRDFLFGSVNAKTLSLQFWVRSSLAGTYCVALQNGSPNRSFIREYTITSANVWQLVTLTYPGDTSGTWATDVNAGFAVHFVLARDSGIADTPNQWNASGRPNSINQVNWMATISNTFDITGVQLELGSSATPFEYRPFPIEVQLCQRYFEKSYALDTVPGTNTSINMYRLAPVFVIGDEVDVMVIYKVPKRAVPTNFNTYTVAGVSGSWGWWSNTTATRTDHPTSANPIGENTSILFQTAVLTDRNGGDGHWAADARL